MIRIGYRYKRLSATDINIDRLKRTHIVWESIIFRAEFSTVRKYTIPYPLFQESSFYKITLLTCDRSPIAEVQGKSPSVSAERISMFLVGGVSEHVESLPARTGAGEDGDKVIRTDFGISTWRNDLVVALDCDD